MFGVACRVFTIFRQPTFKRFQIPRQVRELGPGRLGKESGMEQGIALRAKVGGQASLGSRQRADLLRERIDGRVGQ